jgi:hypothetical protein
LLAGRRWWTRFTRRVGASRRRSSDDGSASHCPYRHFERGHDVYRDGIVRDAPRWTALYDAQRGKLRVSLREARRFDFCDAGRCCSPAAEKPLHGLINVRTGRIFTILSPPQSIGAPYMTTPDESVERWAITEPIRLKRLIFLLLGFLPSLRRTRPQALPQR